MKFENSGQENFRRAAQLSRRTFLKRTSTGVGGVALTSMLSGSAGAGTVVAGNVVIPPRCKRVIHLCMAGGPSHLGDLGLQTKAGSDGWEVHAQIVYRGSTNCTVARATG